MVYRPVASKAPHVDPSSDAVSGEIVATDPISKAAQTVAGSSLTKAIQVDEIGQITGTGNIVEASQAAITASLTGFKSPPTNQSRQDHVYTVDIGNGSWTWRQLLKLRGLAARFLRARVGNGTRINFWFDHWTVLGPLINAFGPTGPSELALLLVGISEVLVLRQQKNYRLL